MPALFRFLLQIAQGVATYVLSTVAFDVVHWVLHQMEKSNIAFLRWLADFHEVHHRFLDRRMQIREEHTRGNVVRHLIPETATSLAGSALFFAVFAPIPVVVVLVLHVVLLGARIVLKGRDSHHQPMDRVRRPAPGLFADQHYHALHHVYPDHFHGSMLTVFDRIAGTACQISGRTFAVTGASGAYGRAMCEALEARGATVHRLSHGRDWSVGEYDRLDPILADCDVLVLAHGVKEQDAMAVNADSFVVLTQRFRALRASALVVPEVWAVGSEIEVHPAFGAVAYHDSKRAWARVARHLLHDRTLILRHIVPAAFDSDMGPGIISGRTAVRWTLALITRGVYYVPVSYTPLAYLGIWKVLARWHAEPPEAYLVRRGLVAQATPTVSDDASALAAK